MKHMQMCMTPPQLAQLEPPHHLDSGQNCKLICSFFKKFQCRCVAVKKTCLAAKHLRENVSGIISNCFWIFDSKAFSLTPLGIIIFYFLVIYICIHHLDL